MTLKQNLECIHYVAEKYLADLEACEANSLMTIALETAPIGILQVVLQRDRIPEYFCGLNKNGIPIWSYDRQYAKSIDLDLVAIYTETLVELNEMVLPIWNGIRR